MLKKQVTIRIDEKTYSLLEKEALKQMRSVSGLMRRIIIKYFEESSYKEWTKSD